MFARGGNTFGMSEESAGQQSCFTNCFRMLCDREKAPDQIDIYAAYRAPRLPSAGRQTPRFSNFDHGRVDF